MGVRGRLPLGDGKAKLTSSCPNLASPEPPENRPHGNGRVLFALAIAGGPTDDESLSQWTARLRKQSAEQERSKQKIVEQNRVQEHASLESRDTIPTPEGRVSSPGGGDTEHEFRVQAASFPEVEELTRDNRGKLEDVKRLLGKPAVDTVRLGTELTDREKLRELDRLVAMAKTLGEMTVSCPPSQYATMSVGQGLVWTVSSNEA